jgi:FkbM family methyltransferase
MNGLGARIRVHGNAVSDAPREVDFGSVGRLSGANSIVSTSIHNAANFRRRSAIQATTLDSGLDKDVDGPLAIKIDVEGHELAVLDGATETLRTNAAVIQIEGYGDRADEIANRLKAMRFDRVTAIGTDHYFTNIEFLRDAGEVVAIYERASRDLISSLHTGKPITIEQGDFRLAIDGKTAKLARSVRTLLRNRKDFS